VISDERFAATYGIPMITGSFYHERGGRYDSTRLVLNESAARALGYTRPEEAMGASVRVIGYPQTFTVTGVTRDFHFGSLQKPIEPLLYLQINQNIIHRFLTFRLRPGALAPSLEALRAKWSVLFPDAPFDYTFMDDALTQLYASELRMRKAAQAATAIAVLMVLLGVLGVVVQSMARRTKEVGIRKVLGASVVRVVLLFFHEFTPVFLVANLLAWPLAWYGLNRWLDAYAYRIHLTWTPFALVTVVLCALVSAVIVGVSLRLARTNPVRNLRSE
jgi:putative ABC transport system permease protein